MPRPLPTLLTGALAALVVGVPVAGAAENAAPAATTPAAKTGALVGLGSHNVFVGRGTFRPFAAVIGWQEVNAPKDRRRMRRELRGYSSYVPKSGAAAAVPISWRSSTFAKTADGSVMTHGGEAKVTPSRWINWVVLRHRSSGRRMVVVNTHFISGAWSKHPERQQRWRTHARILRQTVSRLQQTWGPSVYVVGDMNRGADLGLPGERRIPVRGTKGIPIDQIYAPAGPGKETAKRLPRMGSDHAAYRTHVTLR